MSAPRSPHLAIRASAGAGKTFRLSSRYLALLARGERPERILATTFTRKAAAEIAHRVLLRLARAARDATACAKLEGELGGAAVLGAPLSLERVRELLSSLGEALPRCRIATLDSFFQSVAFTEAPALALPAGWRFADEAEDQELREEAARATLASSGSAAAEVLTSLLGVAGEAGLRVSDRLARLVQELFAAHRELKDARWNLLPEEEPPSPDAVERIAAAIESCEVPRTKSGTPNKNWQHALPAALAAVRTQDWIELASSGLVKKVWEGETKFSQVEIPAALIECLEAVGPIARQGLLARHAVRMRRLHEFLLEFAARYEALQLERGALRFEDLTHRLGLAAALGSGEELWFRLDARIGHLLLDEFQDTSLAQWRVLEPLADEILSTADGTRSFFCVGDVKQAIYGWRGGLSALFDRVEADYTGRLELERLSVSHRSAPAVIDAVNLLFADCAENAALDEVAHRPAAETWARGFEPHVAAKPHLGGEVLLHVVGPAPADEGAPAGSPSPSPSPSRETRFGPTVARVVELVRASLASHPAAGIGVLVRRNRSIPPLLVALREALTVPISAEGGNPLTDSPAVELVLSLLSLADHPGDTRHRYHVATSPLGQAFGIADPRDDQAAERLALRVRDALARAGFAAFTARCMRELAPVAEARDLLRLQHLVRLAAVWDRRAIAARPGEFVRSIERARVEDRVAAPVRVMNVHQAKGLEFDVVILPELEVRLDGAQPPTWHRRTDPRAAGKLGLGVCQHFRKDLHDILTQLSTLERERRRAHVVESLCTLYVAVTRARHALHFVLGPEAHPERAPGATAAGFVRAALGFTEPLDGDAEHRISGSPHWELEPQSQQKPPPQLDLALSLAPPSRPRSTRRAPSAEEGAGRFDLQRVLRFENRAAFERGRAWHALFERVGWLEDGAPPEAELRAELARRGVAEAEIDSRLAAWRVALATPIVQRALSRAAYAPERELSLLREEPFAVRLDGELWSGSFDRLVLTRRAGRVVAAHVVDYKTERFEDGGDESFEARVRFYAPQLESYRRVVGALFALERGAVRTSLLFPFAGRVWDEPA